MMKVGSYMETDGMAVSIAGDEVRVNGVLVDKLPGRGHNLKTTGGRIFVNGYELRNGHWVRTIRSVFSGTL